MVWTGTERPSSIQQSRPVTVTKPPKAHSKIAAAGLPVPPKIFEGAVKIPEPDSCQFSFNPVSIRSLGKAVKFLRRGDVQRVRFKHTNCAVKN